MIGPIYLRDGLVTKFKDHISSIPYCIVIHNAKTHSTRSEKDLEIKEVTSIVNNFIRAKHPIVSWAGSKSSIPFWEYHIALNSDNNKEVFVSELLVRGPKDENTIKGILMAYYMLISQKHHYERLVVPLELVHIKEYDDIIFEYDRSKKLTYVYSS